jgi:hypothetical protein
MRASRPVPASAYLRGMWAEPRQRPVVAHTAPIVLLRSCLPRTASPRRIRSACCSPFFVPERQSRRTGLESPYALPTAADEGGRTRDLKFYARRDNLGPTRLTLVLLMEKPLPFPVPAVRLHVMPFVADLQRTPST